MVFLFHLGDKLVLEFYLIGVHRFEVTFTLQDFTIDIGKLLFCFAGHCVEISLIFHQFWWKL